MRKSRNDSSKKGATTLKRNLITKPVFFTLSGHKSCTHIVKWVRFIYLRRIAGIADVIGEGAKTKISSNCLFLTKNGKRFKVYRGMASLAASIGRKSKETGSVSFDDDLNDYVAEGVEAMVPYKGTVVDILKQLTG